MYVTSEIHIYVLSREVLSNLLTEDQLLDDSSFTFSPLGFPSNGDPSASMMTESKMNSCQNDPLSIVLNVPTAFGIKTTQDKVTYINKGEERGHTLCWMCD